MKQTLKNSVSLLAILTAATTLALNGEVRAQGTTPPLNNIQTVVVIYAENRSFDNLYGGFPGANGLQNVKASNSTQVDRAGPCSRNYRRYGTA
jgi:phospholipase C